jgi:hypothetical protein
MGGFCGRRTNCAHHSSPTNRVEPAERLCDRGEDGFIDGHPIRIRRGVGEWEREGAGQMAPAGPWDALA